VKRYGFLFLIPAFLLAAGCAKKSINEAGLASGETVRAGAALAYEHTISVAIRSEKLTVRMEEVRAACSSARFGSCSMLEFEELGGDFPSGTLVLRVVPEGIESLVTLASEGGIVRSRSTHAEDLAEPIADVARQKLQLETQLSKLLEFQARADLSVADMIALARERGTVDSQLAMLQEKSANQARRIETNLLTLRFSTRDGVSRWSNTGRAIVESIDSFADGVSEAIAMVAFGIPFVLIAFPAALMWRWLWRRATSTRSKT
jgi:hypothetical protein